MVEPFDTFVTIVLIEATLPEPLQSSAYGLPEASVTEIPKNHLHQMLLIIIDIIHICMYYDININYFTYYINIILPLRARDSLNPGLLMVVAVVVDAMSIIIVGSPPALLAYNTSYNDNTNRPVVNITTTIYKNT